MTPKAIVPAVLVVLVALSCGPRSTGGDEQPSDDQPTGPVDAGEVLDSGEPDAGEPPDAGEEPDAGPPDAGKGPLSLKISSGDLVPPFSPSVVSYTLTSYTRLAPVTVTVGGTNTATVNGVPVTNNVPHQLPAMNIVEGTTLSVLLDSVAYVVRLMPPDMPRYVVTSNGPTSGQIFFSPAPYLLILDETGALLFYKRVDGFALDFKRHLLPGGVVCYSYLANGDAYLLDENFKQVKRYRLLGTNKHSSHAHGQHDFEVLGADHVVMQADIEETVTNIPADIAQADGGSLVTAAVVQEVKNGQVVFEWDSTDHPELYELSTEGNDYTAGRADYAHLNSVAVDPADGNLVISFRHLDAVLKVDRVTGQIIWRLGGANDSFGTPLELRPSHQHTAEMIGGNRLQLFDNGFARLQSRVLTYDLDPVNGKLTSFDSLETGYFVGAMGSAQYIPPHSVLMGMGLHAPGIPDIVEFDRTTGTQTFTLSLPNGAPNYRVFKYP